MARFAGVLLLTASAGCAPDQKVSVRARFDGTPSPARLHLKRESAMAALFGASPKPWLPEGVEHAYRDNLVFDGQVEFEAPVGQYLYELERGLTFRPLVGTLVVEEGNAASLDATFERLVDPEAQGWYAGDLHNHRSAADTPALLRTEVLHVAPVVTWSNEKSSYAPSQAEPRLLPHGGVLDGTAGEDERVGGALMFFRLKQPLQLPPVVMDGKRYLHLHGDPRCELPTAASFARAAHADSGAHVSLEKPFWWDAPTLIALGVVDSLQLAHNQMWRQASRNHEAWGRACDKQRFPHPVFGNAECSVYLYYQYLELGFHLPPAAGSASGLHLNPLGYDRVYVHTGVFDHDAWWQGLEQGRSFVTNGPLLFARVNRELPGHTFQIALGEALPLDLDVQLHSNEAVARVELVQNAKVVSQGRIGDAGHVQFEPTQLSEGGWFLIRAQTVEPRTFQFASTAPFYVEVAGARPRISRQAAAFFEQWVSERIARIREGGAAEPRLAEMLAPHLDALQRYEQLRARATVP